MYMNKNNNFFYRIQVQVNIQLDFTAIEWTTHLQPVGTLIWQILKKGRNFQTLSL
jgi:hypothetical protein